MGSKLKKLPVFGGLIKRLDEDVKTLGLQAGFAKTFASTGNTVTANIIDPSTIDVLQNESCVVVGNHPHEIEVLAVVASMPQRKDSFVVANGVFLNICESLDKYILPVYVTNNSTGPSNWPFLLRFLGNLHPVKTYTPQEEHDLNVSTISRGSKHLMEGGSVSIYPDRHSTNGHWFNGIGHMVKGASDIKRDLYFVATFVEGTTGHDYLRLFGPLRRLLPQLTVTYSAPMKINDLLDLDAKEITVKLEEKYRAWVKSIGKEYVIQP